MKKILFYLFVFGFTIQSAFSQSSFTFTTAGTTPQIDSAINYAGGIWSQYLNSPVPIKVNIVYTTIPIPGVLGFTMPNLEKNFSNVPFNDVWYTSSLANSIALSEVNIGEYDMDIYMNSTFNYYFGLDGNPPSNAYDFVSVLIHEMAHGLGGISLCKMEGNMGSLGTITLADLWPIVPPGWSQGDTLGGFPSIWDKFLVNGNGDYISDTLLFPNPSVALGNSFKSNDLFFNGANAIAGNSGALPKMYAPSVYQDKSSVHHFNESTYPNGSINDMFTPSSSKGHANHNPGPMFLGALVDIGWSINFNIGIQEFQTEFLSLNPNPSNGMVDFEFEGNSFDLKVLNLTGQLVVEEIIIGMNDLTALEGGIYIVSGTIDDVKVSQRLILLD